MYSDNENEVDEDFFSEISSIPSTPGISYQDQDTEFDIENQNSPVITNSNFNEILFMIRFVKNIISNNFRLLEEVRFSEAIENMISIEDQILQVMNSQEHYYYNSTYISCVENALSTIFNTIPEIF